MDGFTAVIFGAAIAKWLPEYLVAASVAVLFALFGAHALRVNEEDTDKVIKEKSGHGIFFMTFLITVAEFSDKTQLAVVGFSSTAIPSAVWLGSTSALIMTSVLGVLAGRTLMKKIPLSTLHRFIGIIFVTLSIFAAYKA